MKFVRWVQALALVAAATTSKRGLAAAAAAATRGAGAGAGARGAALPPTAHHKLPRIHVSQKLGLGREIALDPVNLHYVTTVMRLRPGASCRLFNSNDGEFLGVLAPSRAGGLVGGAGAGAGGGGKRVRSASAASTSISLTEQLRSPDSDHQHQQRRRPLHLFFAPLKPKRVRLLLEKATELGVDRLVPVVTQNTNEKWAPAGSGGGGGGGKGDADEDYAGSGGGGLGRILVESAEQCERLSVPVLQPEPLPLSALLATFAASQPPGSRLLVCRERCAAAVPLLDALRSLGPPNDPVSLLVGPEGGFTEPELSAMADCAFVRFVSLGPLVLRAETAAIAALAVAAAEGQAAEVTRNSE